MPCVRRGVLRGVIYNKKGEHMRQLVKIYRDKAVFLDDKCRIAVENITPQAKEIINFYKKLNYHLTSNKI